MQEVEDQARTENRAVAATVPMAGTFPRLVIIPPMVHQTGRGRKPEVLGSTEKALTLIGKGGVL